MSRGLNICCCFCCFHTWNNPSSLLTSLCFRWWELIMEWHCFPEGTLLRLSGHGKSLSSRLMKTVVAYRGLCAVIWFQRHNFILFTVWNMSLLKLIPLLPFGRSERNWPPHMRSEKFKGEGEILCCGEIRLFRRKENFIRVIRFSLANLRALWLSSSCISFNCKLLISML